MKGLLLFIGILVAAFYLFYPPVSREKLCYEKTQKSYDDIGFKSGSRGWGQKEICENRWDVLSDLQDCVTQATAASQIARYTNSFIEGTVSFIRPFSKEFFTLRAEHNEECSQYPNYQLE